MTLRRSAQLAAAFAALTLASGGAMVVPAQAQSQSLDLNANAARAATPQIRTVTFATAAPTAAGGVLILPLRSAGDLAARGANVDAATQGQIERALTSGRFTYGARQTLSLRGVGAWDRILVVGLGDEPAGVQASGAVAGRALISETVPVTVLANGLSAEATSNLVTGMGLGAYRSDLYRTTGRDAQAPGPITVVTDNPDARALYESRGAALVEAMAWARDVSNEPPNMLYPETFVERAQAALRGVRGVTTQVLDEAEMRRLGMGALLSVSQGSARPPRLLVVRYRGAGAPEGGPIALVGKGITFDSGGLSLKPGAGMGDMKMDMSGAASVVGAVMALAKAGAPVDVVAVAALAENMPDGRASRPSDVVTAMNGKTIEIISTDAEGRMVLSDALVWTERNLNPQAVVDVATLTGAVGGALGSEYAGLFSRHDDLAAQLEAAGRATGERLWQLPLHSSYAGYLSSTTADLRNTGTGGAGAGTGAWFIGEFLSRDTPWAHLDIANMAYSGANDWKPAGSAGFSVRLLEEFVRNYRPVARGVANGGG